MVTLHRSIMLLLIIVLFLYKSIQVCYAITDSTNINFLLAESEGRKLANLIQQRYEFYNSSHFQFFLGISNMKRYFTNCKK